MSQDIVNLTSNKRFDLPDEELQNRINNISFVKDVYGFYAKIEVGVEEKSLKSARRSSFIWDIKPVSTPTFVEATPIYTMNMFSPYSSPMMFKPTLSEILSQIPDELANSIKYFSIFDDTARVYDDKLHEFIVCLYV